MLLYIAPQNLSCQQKAASHFSALLPFNRIFPNAFFRQCIGLFSPSSYFFLFLHFLFLRFLFHLFLTLFVHVHLTFSPFSSEVRKFLGKNFPFEFQFPSAALPIIQLKEEFSVPAYDLGSQRPAGTSLLAQNPILQCLLTTLSSEPDLCQALWLKVIIGKQMTQGMQQIN